MARAIFADEPPRTALALQVVSAVLGTPAVLFTFFLVVSPGPHVDSGVLYGFALVIAIVTPVVAVLGLVTSLTALCLRPRRVLSMALAMIHLIALGVFVAMTA